jgi:surface antigen
MQILRKPAITRGLIGAFLLISSGANAQGQRQTEGATAGAVVGGIIGSFFGNDQTSKVIGGVIGAVAGGLVGGHIGAILDEEDRRQLNTITQQTMESGRTNQFRNDKTKITGTAKVTETGQNGGQVCKTVEQEIIKADGSRAVDTIKACKGPNGWQS